MDKQSMDFVSNTVDVRAWLMRLYLTVLYGD